MNLNDQLNKELEFLGFVTEILRGKFGALYSIINQGYVKPRRSTGIWASINSVARNIYDIIKLSDKTFDSAKFYYEIFINKNKDIYIQRNMVLSCNFTLMIL